MFPRHPFLLNEFPNSKMILQISRAWLSDIGMLGGFSSLLTAFAAQRVSTPETRIPPTKDKMISLFGVSQAFLQPVGHFKGIHFGACPTFTQKTDGTMCGASVPWDPTTA